MYAAAFAFGYLLDNTKTTLAAKGRDVALYIANESMPSSAWQKRQYCLAMALTYTWLWSYLTDTQRATLRDRVADYVNSMRVANPAEFLWGLSHANLGYVAASLPAILQDGDNTENTTWAGWMDDILDAYDNGANDCFLAGFRHFGNTDGGTHKGAGPHGYLTVSSELYNRLIPSLKLALGVDFTTEAWWRKMLHWQLWHYRGDRTLHRQGENRAWDQFPLELQFHAWMVADLENNDFGKACQWLATTEMEAVANASVWGPYNVLAILHHNTGRLATKPTITNQGGSEKRTFAALGKAAFREGWETDDISLLVSGPKKFTGGHSHRDALAFWLARSKPLFVSHGRYDANQYLTYKHPTDSTQTGHRWTYYAQGLAHSGISIFDSDEPTENPLHSHQRLIPTNSRFGVGNGSVTISNQGGLLWPKGVSGTRYQPYSYADLVSESVWQFDTIRHDPAGTTKYEYIVLDGTDWFYSSKVTKARRHVLWVKAGQIPGWPYPVIILYDDLSTHVDATAGKLTQRLFFQTQVAPTGSASSWQVDRAPDRCFVKILNPSVEWNLVTGYKDLDAVEYPGTGGSSLDDSAVGVHRAEINPASSGATQEFLTVLFPCANTESSPPTTTLINSGGYIGATIGGVDCKVATGDTHSAVVGDSPDTTPPAAPTNLDGTALNQAAELDWDDNAEGDLDHYEVWRRNAI